MATQSTFTTVRSEGGLLPPDLLTRIVGGDRELGGLAPTDYGFPASERLGEAISRSWNRAKTFWQAFKADRETLAEEDTGVSETRDWVLRLLRELVYERPEYRASAEEINGRRYPIPYRSGPVPLHILSYRQDIDRASVTAAGQPRLSPHALLQEYLNSSDAALYGILTNGLRLRLLRDNASLTRLATLEFDLESMFENSVYADFVLLFLALHRTRLPREGQAPNACWLEIWREKAETQGTRALGALRTGVEKAIEALGNGLLAHPSNDDLRNRLRHGELPTEAFYAELLRLVYRFIFLFVAEERDLLHPEDARPRMRQRYMEYYSASRLRRVARRFRTDDRHDNLWRSVQVTFDLLAGRREGLDLVALEGIFATDACPDFHKALLGNNYLAEAILQLSNVSVDKRIRRVNYRDIGAEELGGVYEGLLERQPRVAVDAPFGKRFELVGSGQRKTTGSYYTPSSLVNELIRSALEPVIADRLSRAGDDRGAREQALLGISVCDPASGSGHFLLAAARRIAGELARVQAGDREPSPAHLRQALRDVIRHCIHGIDANPLAVDLCRLSLWLEGHDAGRPLSFLDHRVKLGNSLIGATPDLVADGIPDGAFEPVADDERAVASRWKKQNRQEREARAKEGERQATFLSGSGGVRAEWARLAGSLAATARAIGDLSEDGPRQVVEQRAQYEAYRREQVDPARAVLDAWTAAFFWTLRADAPIAPVTTADLHVSPGQLPSLSPEQRCEVERLCAEHRFFHWPLEFAEVFDRGGFDCVLGNPPWERIKLQEQEFFAERDPEIAKAPNKAARQKLIDTLPQRTPALARVFGQAKRTAESQSKFVRSSDRFPLTAVGDVNVYSLFAEHDRTVLNDRGRAGVIVPTGIATDDSTKAFFQDIVDGSELATLFDFENREDLFPGVGHGRSKFSLLTLSASRVQRGDFAFFLTNPGQIRDERRRFQLSAEDFPLLNPNTRTCPVFRTVADADLTRAIYRRVPVLVDEGRGLNPWGVEFLRMLDMSNDSDLFHDAPGPGLVPLYEAKLFHHFNHRYGDYALRRPGSLDSELPRPTPDQLRDPEYSITPRYWVDRAEVEDRVAQRWGRGWLLAFRNIARATDERTAIFAVIPPTAVGHSAPIILPRGAAPNLVAALAANLAAMPFDYVVRQKLGGVNMTFGYIYQFAVLPPFGYTPADLNFIIPRVLELTYTAWDLKLFAKDLDYDGPPFRWDEERRAQLRAELDAYYAALYGLIWDELRYILDPSDVYGPDFPGETFRVLKEREIKQYGEYRTRCLVLEAWNRFGLEPRNRNGRYDASPTDKSVASAPRHVVTDR